MEKLFAFLARLEAHKIHFVLKRIRDESILIDIAVPGQRWEVEFMEDGTIEVEVFKSPGVIEGDEALERLFKEFGD